MAGVLTDGLCDDDADNADRFGYNYSTLILLLG